MKAVMVKLVPGVLILLVLLAAALISCGKGKGSLAPTGARTATQDSAAQDTGVRKAKSLEDALAELNALEKPLQADPDAWLAMKAKLAKLLTAKLGEGKSAMKYVPCFDQLNAAKTSASKDYVKPRGLHWEKDSDPYSPSAYGKLVWTYVNDGDYDQDGIVGISDITPLAIHLAGGQGQPVVGDNTILELIDEDGKNINGDMFVEFNEALEYDGVNDATADDLDTIAWDFQVDVAKYQVWGTDTPENTQSWALVDEVLFEDHITISGMRHQFEYVLANGDYDYYKVRPLSATPDTQYPVGDPRRFAWQTGPNGNDPIVESDTWQMPAPDVQAVSQLPKPATVGYAYKVSLGAVLSPSSPGPKTYLWSFPAGLIDYREGTSSTSAQPIVSLLRTPNGNDACSVTVTNPYGQEAFVFYFVVGDYPPEIVSVEPLIVEPGSAVTFRSVINGSRPIDYDWDFGSAATPSQPQGTIGTADDEQMAVASVTVTNTPGRYTITLTAENAYNTDGPDEFELVVGEPPIINSISPTTALSGEQVEFSASVSGSSPFTYQWTFPDSWSPTTSNDPTPEVTVGYGGGMIEPNRLYSITLAVNNGVGPPCIKTFDFMVEAQWHIEYVDQAVSSEVGMKATSLELFTDDHPGIAYEKAGDLWFAEKNGANWTLTPVDLNGSADVGEYASHEVSLSGDIHIAYFDATNGTLKYASRLLGNWQSPIVARDLRYPPNPTYGEYCDLALGLGGRIGISFFHRGMSNLFYAESYNGTIWTWEQVEANTQPVGYPGEYTSLKFRNDNVAVVSYDSWITANSRILKLAYDTNPIPPWSLQVVDPLPASGYFSSLELNLASEPLIAYQRRTPFKNSLWLAEYDGWWATWAQTEIEATNGSGYYASLELDPEIHAGVSHHCAGQAGDGLWLTYNHPLDFTDPWHTVTVEQPQEYDSWDAGLNTSLAYARTYEVESGFNSYPAISYVNSSPGDPNRTYRLMYAYWN